MEEDGNETRSNYCNGFDDVGLRGWISAGTERRPRNKGDRALSICDSTNDFLLRRLLVLFITGQGLCSGSERPQRCRLVDRRAGRKSSATGRQSALLLLFCRFLSFSAVH